MIPSSKILTLLIMTASFAMRSLAKSGVCRPTGPSDTASWTYYVGKCYAPITVREAVNFNEAGNICSQLYGTNSHLASIGDEEVAGFLVSDKFVTDRRSFRKMMIGLRFARGIGRWSDNSYFGNAGQLSSFQKFGPGQDPAAASAASAHSDLCTVVSFDPALSNTPLKNGRWSLVECSSKLQQPMIVCARIADESDECAPGSHFRPDGLGCLPCSSGMYQPTASRTHCEPCTPPREGYIIDTEGYGATSQLQCHRPLPVLTSIDPGSGLQAGSTMVKLEGANFLIDSNLTVGFGDAIATIVASDPSYIICQSPPYTQISRIPPKSSGITAPVEIRFSNGVTRSTSFVYRPNPTVDRFEPTTFVISGGQNVAVRGSDLDTAQTHSLVLQVSYRGTPYTVLRSHCSLESSMLLLCKTPDLSALLPKAGSSTIARQRRQASRSLCQSPFNARDWSFRFVFVFEQTYQVSADADVPVAIFEDPLVDRWADDKIVNSPSDSIVITGQRLSCGVRANDISVIIADRVCEIQRITAEEIICRPSKQTSASGSRDPVMVQIGAHIAMGVGHVRYAYTNAPAIIPTPAVTSAATTTTQSTTPRQTKRHRVTVPASPVARPTTTTSGTPVWRRRITAPANMAAKPPVVPLASPPAKKLTTPSTPTTPFSTTTTTTASTPRYLFTEPEIIEELVDQETEPPRKISKHNTTPKNPYFVTIFWGPNGPPSRTPDLEKELVPLMHQQEDANHEHEFVITKKAKPATSTAKTTSTLPTPARRVTTESLPVWKPAINHQDHQYRNGNQLFAVVATRPNKSVYHPPATTTHGQVNNWQEQPRIAPPYSWPSAEPPRPTYQQPSLSNPGWSGPGLWPGTGVRTFKKTSKTNNDILWISSTQPPLLPPQRPPTSTTPAYWQPSTNNNHDDNHLNVVQRSSVIRVNDLPILTTTEGILAGIEAPTLSSAILIAIVAGATLIMLMVIIITAVVVSSRARRGRQRTWRKTQHHRNDPRNTTSTRSLHSNDSVSTITFRGGVGNSGSGLSEHGTMIIENGHVLSTGSPTSRANLAAAVATIDRLPLVLHNKINDMLIHAKRIKVTNTLVRGQYGDICLGKLWPTSASSPHDTITVTIKTLNRFVMDLDSTSLIEAFLSDALMLKGFYHRNVSAPYAIAFSGQRPLVIYPYYENGSLKAYITNKNKEILVFQLLDFASQIATAMVYLSAQNFIHKDLATRNCVVTPDCEVKVADNALVKDVYGREYVYVEQARDFLPVRWMAPESLTDLQFSLKSDVWSFGVLIWELLTRGRLPHSQVHNSEVVAFLQQQVQQHSLGGTRPVMRLPRPSNVPPELCDIVDKCCQLEPSRRPTFGWLQERLTTLLDQRHMISSYNVPIMPVEGGNSPTTGT